MEDDSIEIFMDDFSVAGNSFVECLAHLVQVLKHNEEKDIVLNWERCHFMVNEGIVLGHKISEKRIEVDQASANKLITLTCLLHHTT